MQDSVSLPAPAGGRTNRPFGTKIQARAILGRKLLDEFCEASGVSLDDIKEGKRTHRLMLFRREFSIMAKANGIGANLTAKLLHMHYSTVLYHRSPRIRARKKEWRIETGYDRKRNKRSRRPCGDQGPGIDSQGCDPAR